MLGCFKKKCYGIQNDVILYQKGPKRRRFSYRTLKLAILVLHPPFLLSFKPNKKPTLPNTVQEQKKPKINQNNQENFGKRKNLTSIGICFLSLLLNFFLHFIDYFGVGIMAHLLLKWWLHIEKVAHSLLKWWLYYWNSGYNLPI